MFYPNSLMTTIIIRLLLIELIIPKLSGSKLAKKTNNLLNKEYIAKLKDLL